MEARLNAARLFFATREDPYAGGDIANAQRLGAILWLLVVILVVVLWGPSPPTEAIGDAGWAFAGLIALGGIVLADAIRRGKVITTWGRMLLISYGAVFAIAGLEWLAGGVGLPYERVFLLPVLFVAMLHPPRRVHGLRCAGDGRALRLRRLERRCGRSHLRHLRDLEHSRRTRPD